MSTKSPGRKTPPTIKEDKQDYRIIGTETPSQDSYSSELDVGKSQGEPYEVEADRNKLKFAKHIIYLCIVLVVALSVISHFTSNYSGDSLDKAIEMLKMVTTTALGFVFAKTSVMMSSKDT